MERAFLGRLGHWCWGLWVAMGAGVKRARVRRACARARLGVAEVVDIGSSLKNCFGGVVQGNTVDNVNWKMDR